MYERVKQMLVHLRDRPAYRTEDANWQYGLLNVHLISPARLTIG